MRTMRTMRTRATDMAEDIYGWALVALTMATALVLFLTGRED